jgi:hypothetical protein
MPNQIPFLDLQSEGFNKSNHPSWKLSEPFNKGIVVKLFLMKNADSIAVDPATAKFAPWRKLPLCARYGGTKGSPCFWAVNLNKTKESSSVNNIYIAIQSCMHESINLLQIKFGWTHQLKSTYEIHNQSSIRGTTSWVVKKGLAIRKFVN